MVNESAFLQRRPDGSPALVVFVNAGDPGGSALVDLLQVCDRAAVDCIELAVPFPDSPTDGPVIRRSASRALDQGSDLVSTLRVIQRTRPLLRHTKVVLLADWGHSIRAAGLAEALPAIRDSGADAVLLHGLPPLLADEYHGSAAAAGLPVVTTCYHGRSSPQTVREAAERSTSYVYLVSSYGRSGGPAAQDADGLARSVQTLHGCANVPVALGFGIKTAQDVRIAAASGAEAVVVGTAAVQAVERGIQRDSLLSTFEDFVTGLRAA